MLARPSSWRVSNGIGYEQLKAIRKDTMEMLENRDIKGLKGLLDTYAGSYDIPEEIACLLYTSIQEYPVDYPDIDTHIHE